MPNPRMKRVTIHHPKIRVEKVVRQAQADVLAGSGWKPGPLPKQTAKSDTTKE